MLFDDHVIQGARELAATIFMNVFQIILGSEQNGWIDNSSKRHVNYIAMIAKLCLNTYKVINFRCYIAIIHNRDDIFVIMQLEFVVQQQEQHRYICS